MCITTIGPQADVLKQVDLYESKPFPFAFSFGVITPEGSFALGTKTELYGTWGAQGVSGHVVTPWLMTAFSLNTHSQQLAIGCSDSSIRVLNLAHPPADYRLSDKDFHLILRRRSQNAVTAVAFSPDARTLASGTADGTIVVWDTPTQKQLFSLPGHRDRVNTVVFSPDGQYLASGDAAGNVKLWQLAEQEELPLLDGRHAGEVYTVAFSPDPQSQMLASGGEDGLIKLWTISNPHKTPSLLRGHVGPVKTIDFSPDKKHLASGGINRQFFLWVISTRSKIEPIEQYLKIREDLKNVTPAHQGDIVSVAFSNDGFKLWSVSKGTRVSWKLPEIGIQPNAAALAYVRKPTPLIEQLPVLDKTGPAITVSTPSTEIHNVASTVANFSVEGRVTDMSRIKSLTVQNKTVPVDENGDFSTSVTLSEGTNTINIVAIDKFGNRNDKTITISRQPPQDDVKPTIKINTPRLTNKSATVNNDRITVKGNVTDNKSKGQDISVTVNGKPLPAPTATGDFNADVELNVGNNPITVSAIDERGNEKTYTFYIQRSQPPKPSVTPPPPVAKEVPANREEPSQQTDKVVIDITSPTRKTSGEQGQPDRLHGSDGTDFSISGVVYGVDSGIIDAIVKSKTSKRELQPRTTRITKGAVEGVGNFAFPPMELYLGDNEITLTVDLESGKQAVKKVLIERFRGSGQPPEAPIQQPSGPTESPPQVTPPKQDNQPPTLTVNIVEEPGKKGTGNLDFVREVPAPTGSNVEGKVEVFEVTSDTAHFQGKVTDDSRSHNITVKINNKTRSLATDGSFSYSHALDYGKNEITITATDKSDNSVEEKYTVYQRPYREGRDLALFFATENYQFYPEKEKNWSNLYTPIADAEKIAKELRENYGFKTKIFKNLTREKIVEAIIEYEEKFTDDAGEEYQYADDSQLLIYFTGHGYYYRHPNSSKRNRGLIAARDSVRPRTSRDNKAVSNIRDVLKTSLEVDKIRQDIERFGCTNVFVLLDTCDSGDFDPDFDSVPSRGTKGLAKDGLMQYIKDKLALQTQWFMTAAGDESVLDGAIDAEDTPVTSSPFATKFMEALDSRGGEDDLLTVKEVWEFIQKSREDPVYKTHPHFRGDPSKIPIPRQGQFGDSQQDSDFLFFPVVQPKPNE